MRTSPNVRKYVTARVPIHAHMCVFHVEGWKITYEILSLHVRARTELRWRIIIIIYKKSTEQKPLESRRQLFAAEHPKRLVFSEKAPHLLAGLNIVSRFSTRVYI